MSNNFRLGDHIQVTPGFPFNSQKFNSERKGVPLIRIRDIASDDTEVYFDGPLPVGYDVVCNDVLIGMDGNFRITTWKGVPGQVNQRVLRLREKANGSLHLPYVAYLLIGRLQQIEDATGQTTVKHLKTGDVENTYIACLSYEEQLGIANVLSALDEQIEATEALVQKKSLAKIGLCDFLLSGSSRHQTQPLSHYIAGLDSGVSVNSDDRQKQGNEVGVLKTSCVFGGKFSPAEHKAIWAKDTARAKLNPIADSIIISRMNTPELVGESGFVEVGATDLFLPDRLWQTVKNNSVKSDFRWLAQVLQWGPVRKAIKDQATGTSNSMKNISKAAFLGVHVPALTFDEQLIAAEVLLAADAEIDLLKQEIEKLKSQKQGLMRDLLTGAVRLTETN